jgi:hypothetical protein
MMINLKITVFVLCIVSALSLKAENRFETLCWDAMVEMTNQYSGNEKINNAEVYRWVDDNYVYKPLKKFLKRKWLITLKSDKNFTLNNLYVMKDKYLSSCVAAISKTK